MNEGGLDQETQYEVDTVSAGRVGLPSQSGVYGLEEETVNR